MSCTHTRELSSIQKGLTFNKPTVPESDCVNERLTLIKDVACVHEVSLIRDSNIGASMGQVVHN